jgi:hypothetical protein
MVLLLFDSPKENEGQMVVVFHHLFLFFQWLILLLQSSSRHNYMEWQHQQMLEAL